MTLSLSKPKQFVTVCLISAFCEEPNFLVMLAFNELKKNSFKEGDVFLKLNKSNKEKCYPLLQGARAKEILYN